jgi:hypothetical protein
MVQLHKTVRINLPWFGRCMYSILYYVCICILCIT